jgi:hypothetical protein
MSAAEWDDTPWYIKRAYLQGLDEDETVPFHFAEEGVETLPPAERPATRTGVDAGTAVIDLTAMREQLEAHRRGGGRGV